MTANIYFTGGHDAWRRYKGPLLVALKEVGVPAVLSPTCPDPAEVDYLVYLPGTVPDFTPFTKAKAVLSLWAGVETITGDPTLTQPLARLVDGSLAEGMVEYVTGHVLRHHLDIDRFLGATEWNKVVPPLARQRKVTVLGLGQLGAACAAALAGLRFDVAGWSRAPRRTRGSLTATFSASGSVRAPSPPGQDCPPGDRSSGRIAGRPRSCGMNRRVPVDSPQPQAAVPPVRPRGAFPGGCSAGAGSGRDKAVERKKSIPVLPVPAGEVHRGARAPQTAASLPGPRRGAFRPWFFFASIVRKRSHAMGREGLRSLAERHAVMARSGELRWRPWLQARASRRK
ncbi:Rossmann-fold NAD(P)-binding domain-containing protein [Mangrovicoccus ximenensis]|uniref:hypothetical protein n=1 Tax=Mangrovicoccus ximenensis TaxID=1911570 RepID=UPI000D33737C|nr:hypothetical protein [Mangrovicoccus ximenensis]